MNEIYTREATLTDIDDKLRLVDLIAVPWEQETEVMHQGDVWREVFRRGAFDGIEGHAGRVRVNREHRRGDTVGKVVQFDEDDERGLLARVRIAKTDRGDETLALAEEDMISASVGYFIKSNRDRVMDRRKQLITVKRAFLDHLAMVESPAYAGASVLAVREGPPEREEASTERVERPLIDKWTSRETLTWARRRAAERAAGSDDQQFEGEQSE